MSQCGPTQTSAKKKLRPDGQADVMREMTDEGVTNTDRSRVDIMCHRFKSEMAHRRRRNRLVNAYSNRSTTSTIKPSPNIIVKRYVTCSVQTDDELPTATKKRDLGLNQLESVSRITNLPVVETGWNYAEGFYKKIKNINPMIQWTLDSAETSAQSFLEAASPAMVLLKGPITSIDQMVCRSLDIVEQTVPSINLPPEVIYWNTKQYMTEIGTKIAQPVLKRADSVKQIGESVLASKYTAYAADTLDGALKVADKYVDKYLPDENDISPEDVGSTVEDGPKGKAIHTMHHAKGFSKKLRKRLTQRTIAEVKALKHQSAEAVHVLTYVVELIATDPVLAYQKGKELWMNLSKDEPENQARPENLEQLIVLLSRESARRMVHLINFSGEILSKIPKKLSYSITSIIRQFIAVADTTVKNVNTSHLPQKLVTILKSQGYALTIGIKNLNDQFSEFLEQVAETLSKPEENSKSVLVIPQITVQTPKATIRKSKPNGLENNL